MVHPPTGYLSEHYWVFISKIHVPLSQKETVERRKGVRNMYLGKKKVTYDISYATQPIPSFFFFFRLRRGHRFIDC